jgi:hypothetical protein
MPPKDICPALGMFSLMLHFSLTWIGLLISEHDNGLWIISDLREEMYKNRVHVAFEKMIPVSFDLQLTKSQSLYQLIIKSSTNVIIIFGDTEFLLFLMINLQQFLMTGKVWVMNSHCDITLIRRHFMLDSVSVPLFFHITMQIFLDSQHLYRQLTLPDTQKTFTLLCCGPSHLIAHCLSLTVYLWRTVHTMPPWNGCLGTFLT